MPVQSLQSVRTRVPRRPRPDPAGIGWALLFLAILSLSIRGPEEGSRPLSTLGRRSESLDEVFRFLYGYLPSPSELDSAHRSLWPTRQRQGSYLGTLLKDLLSSSGSTPGARDHRLTLGSASFHRYGAFLLADPPPLAPEGTPLELRPLPVRRGHRRSGTATLADEVDITRFPGISPPITWREEDPASDWKFWPSFLPRRTPRRLRRPISQARPLAKLSLRF